MLEIDLDIITSEPLEIKHSAVDINDIDRLIIDILQKYEELLEFSYMKSVMMMMMMMMNCFYGMVDRRKAFSLISSRDHC